MIPNWKRKKLEVDERLSNLDWAPPGSVMDFLEKTIVDASPENATVSKRPMRHAKEVIKPAMCEKGVKV